MNAACRSRATRDVTRGRSYTETRSYWICMPFVGGKRGPIASRAVKLRRNNNKAQRSGLCTSWARWSLNCTMINHNDSYLVPVLVQSPGASDTTGTYLLLLVGPLISDVKDKPISPARVISPDR